MAKGNVIWSEDANKDIDEIFYGMTLHSDAYAQNWADELYRHLDLLTAFPEMGRIVPEKEVRFLREIIVWKYRILYTFLNSQITIIRVVHSSRPLGKI